MIKTSGAQGHQRLAPQILIDNGNLQFNMNMVIKNQHIIGQETRSKISMRYKTITKAINREFWNSDSETAHSRYVGSYGRGTAIESSDLDVLVELPNSEYEHFASLSGNGPSRLLQAVKTAIQGTYTRTDVRGDGQVVVINFSDGMKFEVLPAFQHLNPWGFWDGTYIYPDSNTGGRWRTTEPKAEQEAMRVKNSSEYSNGLLFDTCQHIRAIREESFSSYHLSGILIDSFVYAAIGDWHWQREGEEKGSDNSMKYEQVLLNYYEMRYPYMIKAPGSGKDLNADSDWEVLGKVLYMMAQ